MNIAEMAARYYPRLWSRERIETLVDAGRLTREEADEIEAQKTSKRSEDYAETAGLAYIRARGWGDGGL